MKRTSSGGKKGVRMKNSEVCSSEDRTSKSGLRTVVARTPKENLKDEL
jgi:hypothetical protein